MAGAVSVYTLSLTSATLKIYLFVFTFILSDRSVFLVSGRQDGDDDDEDWAEETTEEAQRRRMEEISDHAKVLTLSEDLEKPLEERVNLFYNFVKVSVLNQTFFPTSSLSFPSMSTDVAVMMQTYQGSRAGKV